jgi:hypothetical protein
MKFNILLFAASLFFSLKCFSQNKANFLKLHGGAEIPIGIFKEGYKTGWGLYATDYYGVSKEGSILISAGITGWKVQQAANNSGLFLTRLGYRHFIVHGLYVQGDGGLAVYTGYWGGPSRFTYGGGIGYLIKSKSGGGFDISARINKASYRSWLGFNIGYQFKL